MDSLTLAIITSNIYQSTYRINQSTYRIDIVSVKSLAIYAVYVVSIFYICMFIQPSMAQAGIGLFNTKELKSSNLKKFKKWNGVLSRYRKESPSELKKCRLSPSNKCAITKWRIFLNNIATESNKQKQIALVNRYLNKRLYIIDMINYNKKDYWATPKQFVNRNGDCEDYAIAKYMSLIHLGFNKNDMRIVVLQDLNLKVAHAILVIYIDGRTLVLDNQITNVIEANRIKHYKPIFSINEDNWWLHRS